MNRFYFTYGSEGHPFYGGWTEVIAPNENIARGLFSLIHPNENGFLPCSSVYSEEAFKRTTMFKNGNRGYFCHERITLHYEVNKAKE